MFLLDKKMFSTIKTIYWLTLYFMLIVAEPEPIKVANNFANKQQVTIMRGVKFSVTLNEFYNCLPGGWCPHCW